MRAREVYEGSDGKVTTFYFSQLEKQGRIGQIAINLFRAQKASARAKLYRGGIRGTGSFKGMAYERKNWAMGLLCEALAQHGASLGIVFGWKRDPETPAYEWVLYVDLPQGQVRFHTSTRGLGPDYAGDWDRQHCSKERTIAFCDSVLGLNADRPELLRSEPTPVQAEFTDASNNGVKMEGQS